MDTWPTIDYFQMTSVMSIFCIYDEWYCDSNLATEATPFLNRAFFQPQGLPLVHPNPYLLALIIEVNDQVDARVVRRAHHSPQQGDDASSYMRPYLSISYIFSKS